MNATNYGLLALIALPLAFAVGCGDPNDNNGNETVDTGDDTGVNDFEATIVATTPFEGVEVTVDGIDATCAGTSCTYLVDEAGTYDVEAWDTYTFVPKTVEVQTTGEFSVEWAEGGCASDPDWDATGPCDEWVPGEYGFPPLEGSYTDEIWGREAEITITIGDTITIENVAGGSDATMSDYDFYGSTDSGSWWSGTIIDEETFSMTKLNATSGEVDEFLFHRD